MDNDWRIEIGAHGDDQVAAAQRLQAGIYSDLGFVTEDQKLGDDGLLSDRWTLGSTHFALYDGDEAVGHLRMIDRRAGRLPAEQLSPGLELPEHCREVSSLAVAPDYADGHPTMMLYRAAFHQTTDTGCTHWACVLEYSLLEVLIGFFNFPFVVVGPEIEYSGTTVPAMVDLYEVWDRIKAGTVSDFFGR